VVGLVGFRYFPAAIGMAVEQWAVRDDATRQRQLSGDLAAPEPATV